MKDVGESSVQGVILPFVCKVRSHEGGGDLPENFLEKKEGTPTGNGPGAGVW